MRNAITAAPNDPDSWEWRRDGATALGAMVTLNLAGTTPEAMRPSAAEARRWINEAIDIAGKRPDLSGKLDSLQRSQQELEQSLTAKGLPKS